MTEAEAKIFARSKLKEGLTVFAGTINPHIPNGLSCLHRSTPGSLMNTGTTSHLPTIRSNARCRA